MEVRRRWIMVLKTNTIRDLLSRYYSGELATCKFCGQQGIMVEGDATRTGELELIQHDFRMLPYGVQISKYAICADCKRKSLETPFAGNGNTID
jgi:hypothetical protein